MAYIVNGKTYTSNPLMDEIIYNCKLILNGIVIKNEYVAHLYETEETVKAEEDLFRIHKGYTFEEFPFDIPILVGFGYTIEQAYAYLDNRELIPEQDRDALVEYGTKVLLNSYVEMNKYYRSLMGLPEYDTDKYNIYLEESDFPADFDTSSVNFKLPIHEQPSIVISALKTNGRLDELIEENRSFNYSYLRFLDDHSIDPYVSRKAVKWDILYMPSADTSVISRFREIYEINRQIYLRRTYQDAYVYRSDYYDHMLIFILLCQTFTDMVADTPEWFIRKDIFDMKTVQFFLEAYGVPFFEEIPIKYQSRIVKNLNNLIENKSSDINFQDILDIFNLRVTKVYRYYLYKKRRMDSDGHYVVDPDLNKMYDLVFLMVEIGDTYDNYIKDLNYRATYDEITAGDEYWYGTKTPAEVKQELLERDFTIEPTKYLTIKTDIRYIDYQKQLIFLLGMILDTRVDINDLKIGVKTIYEGASFKLSDLFIFMELVNNLQADISQEIIRPEDVRVYTEELIPQHRLYYDWWVKERFPELFINKSAKRVFGFNPEVDLDTVKDVLARYWTNFTLKHYSLADFGCENYIPVTEPITSFDRLIEVYNTNIQCYNSLVNFINNTSQDQFEILLARYVFRELFTKDFDYVLYKNPDTTENYTNLDEVLMKRDFVLWTFYDNLTKIVDKESRNKDIAAVLNEIVVNLEYYMDKNTVDYFFSFLSTTNFASITRYIYLMLNVFKSYKGHFIEPVTKYQFLLNDELIGNGERMSDTIMNRTVYYGKFDQAEIHDLVYHTTIKVIEDNARPRLEILDIFSGFDPDPNDDYVYDGGWPDTTAYSKKLDGTAADMLFPYKMADGGNPYGYHGIRKYDVDGKDEYLNLESRANVVEIDGGDISDDFSDLSSDDNYFNKYFKRDINGGSPITDYIVNNNFFKRVYDRQDSQEHLISARTGLQYTEDIITGEATLKEIWREWLSITEFEAIKGDPELLARLLENNEFIEYYAQFLDDLDQGKVKTFLNELQEKKNRGIDLTLTNIRAEDNNTVEWDWELEDLDDKTADPNDDSIKDKNYEGREILDYDFIDEDNFNPGDTELLPHDYNFGDIDLSRIIWIEDIYNQDTSRILNYKI